MALKPGLKFISYQSKPHKPAINSQSTNTTSKMQTFKNTDNDELINNKSKLTNARLLTDEDKIKLGLKVETPKYDEFMRKKYSDTEKEFLAQMAFKARNEQMDENAKQLLDTYPFLSSKSSDPKHISVLHDSKASHISNVLYENIYANQTNETKNVFIEYQPGFGLITQKLAQILADKNVDGSNASFILVETFQKFQEHLNKIKKANAGKFSVDILKKNPFEKNFMFKTGAFSYDLVEKIFKNSEPTKKVNLSVYGIVPWNAKGYISTVYGDYASDRALFRFRTNKDDFFENKLDLKHTSLNSLEYYLYVSEFTLAKLKPRLSHKYEQFSCAMTVFSSLFSRVDVLGEENCEYFFPYPVVATPKKYPYNRFDFKKMYLIKIKFHDAHPFEFDPRASIRKRADFEDYIRNGNNTSLIKDKHLFYLFVNHLFARPSQSLRESLRVLCKNVDFVCRENSVNSYLPVNKIDAYKYFKLFDFLFENKIYSNLHWLKPGIEQYEQLKTVTDKRKQRKQQLIAIKGLNQNLSGQFIVPKLNQIEPNEEPNFSKSSSIVRNIKTNDRNLFNKIDIDAGDSGSGSVLMNKISFVQ
jgi:16S rRNA A1518/A1519 N6-dimethyltransferase RsmA/KsgA/DIM1 with predicted DNA glycosylase/AP lyase activity